MSRRHRHSLVVCAVLALTNCAQGTPSPSPKASNGFTPSSTSSSASPTGGTDVLSGWPPPPVCPTAASGVCTVNIPAGGSNSVQAPSSARVLFRGGWSDPRQESCVQFANGATVTITVDGATVATTVVPCQFVAAVFGACANQWRYDVRFLSQPLSPGNHTATATFHFNAAVSGSAGCTPDPSPGSTPAGTTQSFSKNVIVS